MEEALIALLSADGGVFGLSVTQMNFGRHPQGVNLPALVLNTVSDLEGFDMDGPTGLSRARVQIDCYADEYSQAKQLSRAVRTTLSGYSDDVLQGVFPVGARDGREGGSNDDDDRQRVSLDFIVHYNS